MAIEIERKFLVGTPADVPTVPGLSLMQGYLAQGAATMRVRLGSSGKGWLTVKGPSTGLSCPEFEYRIPRQDALELLQLPDVPHLRKTRHLVGHEGRVWEVDVYHGALDGLVTAEIELQSEQDEVRLPSWLGQELTGRREWSNEALARHGFPSSYMPSA